MERDSKIYVAGHTGLVGSAILRCLQSQGYNNLILRTHQELDLEIQKDVNEFFELERPEYVFLGAAKVGGIYANNTYPADFTLTLHKRSEIDSLNFKQLFSKPQETVSSLL
jgi:GDP-L-fucose synthase